MTQSMTDGFTYASLTPQGEYLNSLKLDEGQTALVNFLQDIPGMQNPPFVYCKVHWISEIGDKGRMIQCFGGQCCEQVTWNRGFGGEPGKFAPTKPKHRYYIPIVHYEQDPKNPAATQATVKYLDMTYSAYNALVTTLQNTTEGLSFFDRDITLTARKVNGAMDYIYDKKESLAQWKTNPVFKEQVEAQLPDVAKRLKNSLPMFITPEEFAEMKPALDEKVRLAMSSHQQQQQQHQVQPQQQYSALPGQAFVPQQPQTYPQGFVQPGQPAQPFGSMPSAQQVYTQPQVAMPAQVQMPQQEVAQPVQTMPPVQPEQVNATQSVPAQPVQEQPVTLPETSLAFDPNALLK